MDNDTLHNPTIWNGRMVSGALLGAVAGGAALLAVGLAILLLMGGGTVFFGSLAVAGFLGTGAVIGGLIGGNNGMEEMRIKNELIITKQNQQNQLNARKQIEPEYDYPDLKQDWRKTVIDKTPTTQQSIGR